MRIVKTDRGYIDLDYVLAVGEPYSFSQGLWGYDITLAFQDKAKQMLYYPEDMGVSYREPQGMEILSYEERNKPIIEALTKKRDEFVALWRGDPLPSILTYGGKRADELSPDERIESLVEMHKGVKDGIVTVNQYRAWANECERVAQEENKRGSES